MGIHTVVISTQHAEPLKATRKKEVEGYDGADETAPSMEEMNKLIIEKVVKRTLSEIILKNGKPALTLYGDHTHNYINPSGKFIIGGPQGEAGLICCLHLPTDGQICSEEWAGQEMPCSAFICN